MVGNDIPFFPIHFDHQPRRVRMDVVDGRFGQVLAPRVRDRVLRPQQQRHRVLRVRLGRDHHGGKNKSYIVPNGQYVVKLSVLKALGDASNPAHWERWDSPVITIARP